MYLFTHSLPTAEFIQRIKAIPFEENELIVDSLGHRKANELIQAFKAIPNNIVRIDLTGNFLGSHPTDDLVQILEALHSHVEMLKLSRNSFQDQSGEGLKRVVAALPKNLKSLDLSNNILLDKRSVAEFAQVLNAIPSGVERLDLKMTGFESRTDEELRELFKAIRPNIIVDFGNPVLQKKYDINYLLDSYIEKRRAVTDSSGTTKEYFHRLFHSAQNSFTQEQNAVNALQSALKGRDVNLMEHLPALQKGDLAKELKTFVKAGMGDTLVGKEVTTISDFVQALQNKNIRNAQHSPEGHLQKF